LCLLFLLNIAEILLTWCSTTINQSTIISYLQQNTDKVHIYCCFVFQSYAFRTWEEWQIWLLNFHLKHFILVLIDAKIVQDINQFWFWLWRHLLFQSSSPLRYENSKPKKFLDDNFSFVQSTSCMFCILSILTRTIFITIMILFTWMTLHNNCACSNLVLIFVHVYPSILYLLEQ
jgi:hypothetical protein